MKSPTDSADEPDFVKGPLECNCKDSSCSERVRQWVDDARKWLDKYTPFLLDLPPLPIFPLAPPELPGPEPVIPGVPPFFINPCLLTPSERA